MLVRNWLTFRPLEFIRSFSHTMSSQAKCKVAVCQFTATNLKDENLKVVQNLVSQAAQKEAQVVFLPEGCDYMARDKSEIKDLAEPFSGYLMTEYRKLAEKHHVWLSIGGFHEVVKANDNQQLYNSHVLLNQRGEIAAVYRKLHLFDVTIPEKNVDLRESSYVSRGTEIVLPIDCPVGQLALGICYDLRFPEFSTILRKLGATVLTFPSAFTSTTGQAHWEVLLRARAIENQCYVVAAAQYGHNNAKRITYGQAMVVDPWGKIIAECPKYDENAQTNQSLAFAIIDPDFINKVRLEMPVFSHRRDDIYKLTTVQQWHQADREIEYYMFADKTIPLTTVFHSTPYTFAFTNIRCVVPGHVLVSSIRQARRLEDLTQEEVADLFQTTVRVQQVVEKVYGSTSSTICVQDGKDAGQTVPHVHCHVLPRKTGDFQRNDDIYAHLAKHDREDDSQPMRTLEEMCMEANLLKSYF